MAAVHAIVAPAEGEPMHQVEPGDMTTLPTDCHQVAAAFALSPRQPLLCRVVALSTSFGVALLQVVVLMAAARAPKERSCLTNDDCDTRATYCRPSIKQCDACSFGYGGACMPNVTAEAWIASQPVDLLSGQNGGTVARTFPRALDYASHCAACVAADGRYGWMSTSEYNHVFFMNWRDWLALFFVAGIIGLFCSHEVRSVKLCEVLVLRSAAQRVGLGWRLGVSCVGAIRQYAVVTVLFSSVCIAIFSNGGDVLSVCLNAVALLFLLEVDDAIFAHAVPEEAKARWAALAAVRINAAEARIISWVKLAYVGLFALCIPLVTASRLRFPDTGGRQYDAECMNVGFIGTVLFNIVEPCAVAKVAAAPRGRKTSTADAAGAVVVAAARDGVRPLQTAVRRLVVVALRFSFGIGFWLVLLRIV